MHRCKGTGLRTALMGVILVTLGATLAGCASLGLDHFNNALGAGYTAVTTTRDLATQRLQAHQISPEVAQLVEDKANQVRGTLDTAARIHAAGGESQGAVNIAIQALDRLRFCINQQGDLDMKQCIDVVEVPK